MTNPDDPEAERLVDYAAPFPFPPLAPLPLDRRLTAALALLAVLILLAAGLTALLA